MLRYSSQIAAIQRTKLKAQAFTQMAARRISTPLTGSTPAHNTLALPNELHLPVPPSLTPRLHALGIDQQSAEYVSLALLRATTHLKYMCEAEFTRYCQILRTSPHFQDATHLSRIPYLYTSVYKKGVQNWVSYITDDFVPRFIKARAAHQRSLQLRKTSGKRPFNQVWPRREHLLTYPVTDFHTLASERCTCVGCIFHSKCIPLTIGEVGASFEVRHGIQTDSRLGERPLCCADSRHVLNYLRQVSKPSKSVSQRRT